MVRKGLIPGNKVENQVGVPRWVKNKVETKRGCLRGLTDTDGYIFVKKAQKSIRIGFQNHSLPLVEGFKELSESFNVQTGNVTSHLRISPSNQNELLRTYEILIAGKPGVSKFIHTIKPHKWENRADLIGLTLITLQDPQKRSIIEKELAKVYPDKIAHNTKEYRVLLISLCHKQGYKTDKKSKIIAIENALTNKSKRELSIDGKKVIDDLKKRWK